MVFRKKQQSNILNDNNSKSFSIMQTPKATHRFLAFMTSQESIVSEFHANLDILGKGDNHSDFSDIIDFGI